MWFEEGVWFEKEWKQEDLGREGVWGGRREGCGSGEGRYWKERVGGEVADVHSIYVMASNILCVT